MISSSNFTKMFSYNKDSDFCLEVEFRIIGSDEFRSCFMGKICDENGVCYWYALAPDGSNAYEYDNFESFLAAPLFSQKTLLEIWDKIEILSIDGCDPEERISFYIR